MVVPEPVAQQSQLSDIAIAPKKHSRCTPRRAALALKQQQAHSFVTPPSSRPSSSTSSDTKRTCT